MNIKSLPKLCKSNLLQVLNFFKERIAEQYPLLEAKDNPLERQREAHEAFMTSKAESVLGRDGVIKEVNRTFRDYRDSSREG